MRAGHSADAIHGDLRQNKRDKVIQAFRDKKHRIMVATDIAARGLDIPHIEHVINYDLPQAPEDYIHRIGRTARAGAEGSAICLITPQDGSKWRAIHKLMHPGEKLEGFSSERSEGGRSGRGRSGPGGRGGQRRKPQGEGESRGPKSASAAPSKPKPEGARKSWGQDTARAERPEGETRSERPARFKPRNSDGQSRSENAPRRNWTKSDGGSRRGAGFAA
jgi:superfamily II DNA/RNA helicase